MAKKSYLITGGSGFIGAALSHALVKAGNKVRILDNQSRGAKRRLSSIEKECEFINADIREPEAVAKAVKGVDAVCHLAFINGTEFFYSMPEQVLDVGVKGMVNVVDACIKHNVSELVLASSSEVYQSPPQIPTAEDAPLSIPDLFNPRYSYAGGKIISELMAINYGRKYFERVLIFRPHNVYGPDMGWEHVIPQFILRIKELAEQSKDIIHFPIKGNGEETRAFIFIDDFIGGLMLMLAAGKHLNVYHIGTEVETNIKQLAQLIGKCLAREIEIVPGPEMKGSVARRCANIDKMKQLGFSPKILLERGLELTTNWYINNGDLQKEKQSVKS